MKLGAGSRPVFEDRFWLILGKNERIDRSLHDLRVGVFGAGHLARSLAARLVHGGISDDNLSICHRDSAPTRRALVEAGLAHLVRKPDELVARSNLLLYMVRPQDSAAIAPYRLPAGALFVSFLAGVPLDQIPVCVPQGQRVRVMPSTPDTFDRGNAIAAVYPGDNAPARNLLKLVGARVFPLRRESEVHVFTVLGPCLPVALALWGALGNNLDKEKILEVGQHFGLTDCVSVLNWALQAQPRDLSKAELETFITQAATEGGVIQAIVVAIRQGKPLSDALCRGIERSIELGQAAGQ